MAEVGVEAEEDLATVEALLNPSIGEEVEAIMKATIIGIHNNHLGMAEGDHPKTNQKEPGGMKIIVVTQIIPTRKEPRIGTTKMSPHTLPKAMMIAKEPEAPAQETPDIREREAQTDINPEENTMKTTAETMELAQATETTVLTEKTMNMKEDTEMIQDLDTLGRALQMKAGDTLVTIGDGDAKGP